MASIHRAPVDDRSTLPVFIHHDDPPSIPFLVIGFLTAVTSVSAFLHSAMSLMTSLIRGCLSWNFTQPLDQMETELEEGRLGVPRQKTPATPLARLDTLPLELLIEILKELEWMDVLRARQTCRLLHETSTAKPIWQGFLDQFASEARVKPKLERPIELYTAAELERIFFQWISVEPGWTARGMRRARQRDIIHQDAAAFHLVEGGRWLLLATRTGSVTYHDLDNPDITERVLIPDRLRWHEATIVLMDVDVDDTAPGLTFNLALSIKRPHGRHAPAKAFEQIFRVHLEFDDCHCGRTLRAEQVVLLPRGTHGYISSLSLLGRFIALYHMNPERNLPPRIILIDWIGADSGEGGNGQGRAVGHVERVIYPGRHEGKIRLIPGNRLVVATQSFVRVYNVLDHDSGSDLATGGDIQTSCAWSFTFESPRVKNLSKPFIVSNSMNEKTARIVVFTSRTIHGIIFAMDKPFGDPLSVKLVDYQPGPSDFNSPGLGYNRGVIRCYVPHQLVMLSYSWPDEDLEVKPPLQKKIVCDRRHLMKPSIDERSGRIVVSTSAGEHIVVLDTALGRTYI